MNDAGNVSDIAAREIVTRWSSSGWRKTSRTLRSNSGNSSRNSTPWCAKLTSPGRGTAPPVNYQHQKRLPTRNPTISTEVAATLTTRFRDKLPFPQQFARPI